MDGWSALTWTVARAGGMTSYALLTLSVVLGLTLSLRWQTPRWPRLVTNELHSFLMAISLVFSGLHGLALWLDPFTRFAWTELLVPGVSHYRPVWTAAGILAGDLAVAVWLSTWVRPQIGYAWWRRLHVATFVVYALATIHGIAAGSDTRTPWALGVYGASAVVVSTLVAARLRRLPIGQTAARSTRRPA
ncbi:MAG: hypothetical protein NVSMB65_09890 [Chloroflexota bacterium]